VNEDNSAGNLQVSGTLTIGDVDTNDTLTVTEPNASATWSGGTFANLASAVKNTIKDGFTADASGWRKK